MSGLACTLKAPFVCPKQVGFVCEVTVAASAVGSVRVTEPLLAQPLLSVAVTV